VDRQAFEAFPLEPRDTKVSGSRRDEATRKDLNVSDGGLAAPPFQRTARRPARRR